MRLVGILFLLIFNLIHAQEINSFVIEDELNIDDPVDLQIGRYEAYELNIGEGDRLAIELKSQDFWPALLLISPSKNSILKLPQENNTVFFDTTIYEGGTWEFYVIGDTNTIGKYSCEVGFATNNALKFKGNDLCSSLNYFTKNSNANFIFLRNRKLTELPGGIEVEKIDNKSCTILFDLKNLMNDKIDSKLLNCLGDGWLIDKEAVISNNKHFRIIENKFKERRILDCEFNRNEKEAKLKVIISKE